MNSELRNIRYRIASSFAEGEALSEDALRERIDSAMREYSHRANLSLYERERGKRELLDSFRGMDILQPALDDPEVSEIMVNGVGTIFLERGGRLERWDRAFEQRETLEDVIQIIAASVNRIVNTSSPIADLRLEDGSRVNIVLPPVAPDGPIMTIRKFSRVPLTMERLIRLGSLTEEAARFLQTAVRRRRNIFISGGTNSGKTTFLNALSEYIPSEERIITIEDSLELQLMGLPNLVRLETRSANLEGGGAVTIRDLIRTALRMRPTRIIVGEVRGEEALDMLQAMNTGHQGSLSTGHANSARDMLSRLETMVLMGGELPLAAIRAQIASALDLLVHLGRDGDGIRRVLSVEEVEGIEHGEIVLRTRFAFRRDEGLLAGPAAVRS